MKGLLVYKNILISSLMAIMWSRWIIDSASFIQKLFAVASIFFLMMYLLIESDEYVITKKEKKERKKSDGNKRKIDA